MNIGKKIKELRFQNGLTQEELAERSELTKGYISQLENDLTSPSIQTLIDILQALGTTLKDFFNEEDPVKIVYKNDDFIEKVTDSFTMNWLVPNAQKNEMEPVHILLKPNSVMDADVPHEGEEFGYVIKGEIVLHFGKKKFVCKKGESFYYMADKEHFIENKKDVVAEFIWISSPPTF